MIYVLIIIECTITLLLVVHKCIKPFPQIRNHKHHRVKFNTETEDVDIQFNKSIDSSPAMEQLKLLQMQANKELQQFESLKKI